MRTNLPLLFLVTLASLAIYCVWLFAAQQPTVKLSVAAETSPTDSPCVRVTVGITNFNTPIPGACATITVTATQTVTSSPSATVTPTIGITPSVTPPPNSPSLEITLPIAKSGTKPDEMYFGGEKFLDLMRPICRIAPGCLSQTRPLPPELPLPGRYHALVTHITDPAHPLDESYQYYIVTITGFSITAPAASPSPDTSPSPEQGGGGGGGTGWLQQFLFGSSKQVGYNR